MIAPPKRVGHDGVSVAGDNRYAHTGFSSGSNSVSVPASDGLNSRIVLVPAKFAGADAADWWNKLRIRVSAPTGSMGQVEVTVDHDSGGD